MSSVNILEIPVTNLSRQSALSRLNVFLQSNASHHVVTANPEILMHARKDEQYKKILQKADLVLPDGIGLMWAARYLGQPLTERIPGSEFIWDIIRLSSERGYKVYLIGGAEGVAEAAAVKMKEKYEGVKIVGAEGGLSAEDWQDVKMQNADFRMPFGPEGSRPEGQNYDDGTDGMKQKTTLQKSKNTELLDRVNATGPDILLVAFGHPKQEYWIAQNLPKMPSVRLAMGVGGTFDFISGKIRRAPRLVCRIGLEWLWRLVRQPWRAGRVWRAVIRFPLEILKEKR